MSVKKHLFIGFGKLAARCATHISDPENKVFGVARSERQCDESVHLLLGDIKSEQMLQRLSNEYFDTVTIILTPDAYTEEAYEHTYVNTVEALVGVWNKAKAPERILFISSTSVYGQNDGELVNELSPANPVRSSAKMLRKAESILLEEFTQSVVIRFSGIYGNGRDYLLRQIWDKKAGDNNYTNRIHESDCCGVICHILTMEKSKLRRIFLASDCASVKSKDIRQWLASKIGVALVLQAKQSSRAGNKRCDNSLLLKSGYKFRFPTYKDGYEKIAKKFMEDKLGE